MTEPLVASSNSTYQKSADTMITHRERDIVVFATSLGSFPVCTFGIVSNIINIIVFTNIGFAESVNVCLVALAAFDLCSHVIIMGVASLGILVSQKVKDLDFDPVSLITLVACFLNGSLYSTVCFISFFMNVERSTACFISSFMNVERCLCFVVPLKVKAIITPRRSALVIVLFFLASICSIVPAYLCLKLDWRSSGVLNRTVLGIVGWDRIRPECLM
ncbi:hypothetical protein EGW08_012556 [Elysia chlorotica]|uniref:G-protein coupled receptors family 1 profile domain-containing protein n=1 Tax=Elysia chlorotica TaxID=188477 RepID=A0A3S1B4I8_ELYCH|nr:hypothetical protein EGW08_012556 [Elysia chlorotica]